jgi:triacylglycerol lipase
MNRRAPALLQALLVGAAAAAVAASCTGPPPPPPAGAVPILFVHGYGENATVWDDMISHLEERGYPADYLKAVSLAPPDGGTIAAAEGQLAPAVEELTKVGGNGKIDIVAHSMGALSSRWRCASPPTRPRGGSARTPRACPACTPTRTAPSATSR